MDKTITAANSVFLLSVNDIFPVAQQLSGYAADNAFMGEARTTGEVVMGVDGHMSGGWLPAPVSMTINIMPDSESLPIFEAWDEAQKAVKELYFANATIMLPSIGRQYTLTKGVLIAVPSFPGVKKLLQPLEYKITWESSSPSQV